jgi:deoxyadenosine/deoxycytidine kinase
LWFLVHRAQAYRDLVRGGTSLAIADRSIYEDAEVFCRNLHELGYVSDWDYETYWQTYRLVRNLLPPPGLVIFLRASVATLKRRIAGRGREAERALPSTYLARLNDLYEDWAARFRLCTLLPIDVDGLDFEHDPVHCRVVVEAVLSTLRAVITRHTTRRPGLAFLYAQVDG